VSDACLALEAEVARLGFVAPLDDDNDDDAGEDQGGDALGPGAARAKLGRVAPADPLSTYIAESVMLTANRQRQQLLERARAVWLETEGSGNTVAVAHATEQRANLFGDFVAAGALEEEDEERCIRAVYSVLTVCFKGMRSASARPSRSFRCVRRLPVMLMLTFSTFDRGFWQLPACRVSVAAKAFVDLLYETLGSISSAPPQQGLQLFFGARDMCDLARALLPSCVLCGYGCHYLLFVVNHPWLAQPPRRRGSHRPACGKTLNNPANPHTFVHTAFCSRRRSYSPTAHTLPTIA
jgi:hypothetical protein